MKVVVNIEPSAAFDLCSEALKDLSYLVDKETLDNICHLSNRAHPALVKVAEDFGECGRNAGALSKLWPVRIPDNVAWSIAVDEDGVEFVLLANGDSRHWDDFRYDF